MTGFFLVALTYYSFVPLSVASGTAPAWYLHAIAPILALLAGYGICEIMPGRWRAVLTALLLYPLVFLPAMTVMNALVFRRVRAEAAGPQLLRTAERRRMPRGLSRGCTRTSRVACPATGSRCS